MDQLLAGDAEEQANLATAVSDKMEIAVVVSSIATTDASRNSASSTQPSVAPTTTETKPAADKGLSAGMIELIICLAVALVIGSGICISIYHRRAFARSAQNGQPTPDRGAEEPSLDAPPAGRPRFLTPDEIIAILGRVRELHQQDLVTKQAFERQVAYWNGQLEAGAPFRSINV